MIDFTEPEVFCGNCCEKRTYTIHERVTKSVCPRSGRRVKYNEWYAICDECGEEVYVSWIEQRNVEEFYAMTRVDEFVEFLKEKYKEDHDDKVKMANKDNGSYWRGRADEAYDMISLMDSDFMEFLSSLRE